MSLIFITGVSGSGKSTICEELNKRGYKAFDGDSGGLTVWQNKETGREIPWSEIDNTPEWYALHSWNISRNKIQELARQYPDQTIFIGANTANEDEIRDLFSKIIYLDVSEEMLKKRIHERTNNNYGKKPHELARTLNYRPRKKEKYEKIGAIMVDADQPLDDVVDIVLKVSF